MKLFLSLLVMGLAAAGLFFLLKPAPPQAPRKPLPLPGPKPPAGLKPPAEPKRLATPAGDPSEDEVRQAVQTFAGRFPRQTARVLQSWIKHPK